MSSTRIARSLNGTILPDTETRAAVDEDKVFQLTLLCLALCVLTVTGIITSIQYYNHRRKSKRAYLSAVACKVDEDPVNLTYVRQTHSFRNLFRRQEGLRDNSRIYYIFSNPTPVGIEEDDTPPHKESTHTPLILQGDASDLNSGITLNPPVFYMQL